MASSHEGKKIDTEFERRLREILTGYPEIDPARATLALKGQPEATNEQIAQLSKFRPEEADRATSKPSKPTDEPSSAEKLVGLVMEKNPKLGRLMQKLI